MKISLVRSIGMAVCLIAASGSIGCRQNGTERNEEAAGLSEAAALGVKAEPVELKEWIKTVSISGSLRSLSVVDVKSEVAGRLVEVHVEEGDPVKKGVLLAKIDDTNYELAYDQSVAVLKVAQAGLERAGISAEYAEREKKRADNLLQTGGITQKDHQAAVNGVKEALAQVALSEAQCQQAEAALAIAEKALKDCNLFSPIDGQVQKRWLDAGSLLSPGSTVVTLVDNSRLELKSVVPAYHLASIAIQQEADFQTPSYPNRTYKGVVTAISPVIQSENRSVEILIRVANPGLELKSGMFARGEIVTGRVERVPVIPRHALIPNENEEGFAYVFVATDGIARKRRIQLGGESLDRVWVREGLNAGDMLIVEGGPSVKDGTSVHVLSEKTELGS